MRKKFLFLLSALFIANMSLVQPSFANEKTFSLDLGDFKFYLLSDGNRQGRTDIIVNATNADKDKYIKDGYFSAVNAFLLVTEKHKILIDTGYGTEVFNNLKEIGINPEQIDTVLITHLHGDHVSGLLIGDKAAFPNADVYVSKKEFDYWMDKPISDKLKPYTQRLKTFEPSSLEQGGLKILPSIFAVAAYGHTPGHTMFLIKSKKEKLLVWGDLTHVTPLQIPMPEIFVTYDINSKEAVATRQKVFDYVVQNDILIAGQHIKIPAIGKMSKDNATGRYIMSMENSKK